MTVKDERTEERSRQRSKQQICVELACELFRRQENPAAALALHDLLPRLIRPEPEPEDARFLDDHAASLSSCSALLDSPVAALLREFESLVAADSASRRSDASR